MEGEDAQKQQVGQDSEAHKHTTHTYADDLARAMDTTDAKVVQELLAEGREREQNAIEEKTRKKQKGWYQAGAIILALCTALALGYSVYHYRTLTVPAEQAPSVGVFPSTEPLVASTTDIRSLLTTLKALPLDENKPTLALLVGDDKTLTLLSESELFSFFEAQPTEPFLASFSIVRLGVMNTETENVPFIIASTKDSEISAKELLIAEPDLLRMLYKPLGIDIAKHTEEVGKGFTGEYLYNIPARTLRYDTKEQSGNLLFFYARATDNIVVFTTKPEVLKVIYNELVRQQ